MNSSNREQPFDTVVRHARIATASDLFTADIGIRDGVVVALGNDLPDGRETVDLDESALGHYQHRKAIPVLPFTPYGINALG